VKDLQKLHCKSLDVNFSFSLFCFHFKDPVQDTKADFTSTPPHLWKEHLQMALQHTSFNKNTPGKFM